ncbi:alpha/beta hydrolase fold protein [Dentipellis sp. KUC8613]|nr:alpha/beta hydrolase fold protein [Dentipellis sp. KUC8613]
MSPITATNNFIEVDGVNVFYRAAGPTSADAPTIVLLHGFPSSSFQFRNLIPLLAHKYRVVAPDHPGFGFTEVPAERKYEYTFANLATTFERFADALGLQKFAIYTFDYGAPIGYRFALAHPARITAVISQNGNMYDEGLGAAFWAPLQQVWADDHFAISAPASRAAFAPFFSPATTKWQYTDGVPPARAAQLDPAAWTLDAALLARAGQLDVQIALFYDYRTNVALYPRFAEWLRTSGVPVLAMWGENDTIFVKAGAEAYRRDARVLEVRYVDSGHFALETNEGLFAREIQAFLEKHVE